MHAISGGVAGSGKIAELPLAAGAIGKIGPDKEVARPQTLCQHFGFEFGRRKRCKASVEPLQKQVIDTQQRKVERLVGQTGKSKGRQVTLKKAPWVRLETQHPQRTTDRRRKMRSGTDHFLMTPMHAIKIADRNYGALRYRWNGL